MADHFDQPQTIDLPLAAGRSVTDPPLSTVLAWWDEHARRLPWRQTRDVYAIWVAEVMTVQTTVGRAAPAWEGWMARWPTVAALAGASLADVLAQWQGLGYPRRARDLHRSARIIVDSGWPADLTALPGVGEYVAAAIRCFAREEAVLPQDVNVRRVLARRFPGGVDIAGDPWRAGQALMEFGQRICSASPRCGACPVQEGCAGAGGPAEPVRRRSPRPSYEGSLRQQRGRLLARVLAEKAITVSGRDRVAAESLAQDGLAVLADGLLRAPE